MEGVVWWHSTAVRRATCHSNGTHSVARVQLSAGPGVRSCNEQRRAGISYGSYSRAAALKVKESRS